MSLNLPNFINRVKKTGLALATGVALISTPAVAQKPKEPTEQTQEKKLTQVERETIAKVLNMSVEEISILEKDYKIELQIPNLSPDGKYVIHIGQSHLDRILKPGDGNNQHISEISKSQTLQYNLLKKLNKKINPKCVFLEGVSVENLDNLDFIKSYSVAIDMFYLLNFASLDLGGRDRYLKVLNDIETFFDKLEDFDTYHWMGERIFQILDQLQNKIENSDLKNDPDIVKRLGILNVKKQNLFEKRKSPNVFVHSAAEILSVREGTPLICFSEHIFLNQQAKIRLDEALQASRDLDKAYDDTDADPIMIKAQALLSVLNNLKKEEKETDNDLRKAVIPLQMKELSDQVASMIEIKPLLEKVEESRKKLTEKRIAYEKAVHYDREKFAIDQVPRYENSVLVYGSGHNFTQSVKDSNSASPSEMPDNNLTQLGLIKITPKTD